MWIDNIFRKLHECFFLVSEKIETIFDKFGFEVHTFQNLLSKQIIGLFHKIATEVDHTNLDAFVCIFLTHGTEGHIYGTDIK